MAWTAPMTAADNATFTAAQYNAHIRDNLLETAPGKATTANNFFIATGANAIAQRAMGSATVATDQQLVGSGVWADLATVGPQVTLTTGTQALVWFTASINQAAASAFAAVSVDISGATTLGASFDWCLQLDGRSASNRVRRGVMHQFTGLTAGSNTFTLKYRNGTTNFQDRELIVMAL